MRRRILKQYDRAFWIATIIITAILIFFAWISPQLETPPARWRLGPRAPEPPPRGHGTRSQRLSSQRPKPRTAPDHRSPNLRRASTQRNTSTDGVSKVFGRGNKKTPTFPDVGAEVPRFEPQAVFKRVLDKQTYQEQSDKLSEEITLAEIAEQDARLDELDIEAAVEFAQYVLLNAARIWSESGPEQKERLQKLIFPAGVLFGEGAYRTTATNMVFFELEEIYDQNEGLVAQTVTMEPAHLLVARNWHYST
jgi:hypothetical protein